MSQRLMAVIAVWFLSMNWAHANPVRTFEFVQTSCIFEDGRQCTDTMFSPYANVLNQNVLGFAVEAMERQSGYYKYESGAGSYVHYENDGLASIRILGGPEVAYDIDPKSDFIGWQQNIVIDVTIDNLTLANGFVWQLDPYLGWDFRMEGTNGQWAGWAGHDGGGAQRFTFTGYWQAVPEPATHTLAVVALAILALASPISRRHPLE